MDLLKTLKLNKCTSDLDKTLSLMKSMNIPMIAEKEFSSDNLFNLVDICNPKSDNYSNLKCIKNFRSLLYHRIKIETFPRKVRKVLNKKNKKNNQDIIFSIYPLKNDKRNDAILNSSIDEKILGNHLNDSSFKFKFSDEQLTQELKNFPFVLRLFDFILIFDVIFGQMILAFNNLSIPDAFLNNIFIHSEGKLIDKSVDIDITSMAFQAQ